MMQPNMKKTLTSLLCIAFLMGVSTSFETGDVRLHLGTNTSGIVQVYDNSTWKTICGWNLAHPEAATVCQQLGFQDGRALPLSAYGDIPDLHPYQHKLMQCQSGTNNLLSCKFDFNTSCADETVAYGSVICLDGDEPSTPENKIKLGFDDSTASQYFTPVAVYDVTLATWGKICNTFWDDVDADVACRQMGYSGGKASVGPPDTSLPFLMFELNCNGSEASLDVCPKEAIFCYDQRSASVVCYSYFAQAPEMTLVGGKLFGTVQLTIDGQTGYICRPSSYDGSVAEVNPEASVICRHLGYTSGVLIEETYIEEGSTGSVVLDGFECEGVVDAPLKCANLGWKNVSDQCQNISMALSVKCFPKAILLGSGDMFGDTVIDGLPVLYDVNSYRHPVCREAINNQAADTICRQLGYDAAEVLAPKTMSFRSPGPQVTSITCPSSADDIDNCTFTLGECQLHDYEKYYAVLLCIKDLLQEGLSVKHRSNNMVLLDRYGMDGGLCDDDWGDEEASVVCRETGHKTGIVFGRSSSPYYRQTYSVWRHKFSCVGTETRLKDCPYVINRDIALTCSNRPAGALCFNETIPDKMVRITNGQMQGRVEVYINETSWGVICRSTGAQTAKVICKQLGYPSGQMQGVSSTGVSLPVAMAYVTCTGTETSLYECANRGWLNEAGCSPSQASNVFCYKHVKIDATFYGRVLIHSGDNYGLVCADTFNQIEASVACKEAGFTTGMPLCCNAFGPSNYNFTRVGTKCVGTEMSLKDCSYDVGATVCPSNQYASVVCAYGQTGYTGVRVTPMVRVHYFSHEGYVCSDNFTQADAQVACKIAGFSFGYSFKYSSHGITYPLRWLRGLKCKGDKTRLEDCGPHDWGQIGVCDMDSVAAAHCTNNQANLDIEMRLVNGTDISGRVEIKLDGQWGTVCGKDLTKSEAVVICKQQNFLDGIMLNPGHFGSGQGNILLSGIKCKGSEDNHIRDCIWSGFKNPSSLCTHSMDAAVKCFYNTRLAGSPLQNYGRLEVYDDDEKDWLLVCDRALQGDTSTKVCRQLGYASGMTQRGSPLGPPTKAISYNGVTCPVGSPCIFTKGSCMSNHYMALYCSDSVIISEDVGVRLPESAFYGPVSIQRFGLWGHVCSNGFDDVDAAVVCSQLKYKFGKATTTLITEGTPIIQGQVDCTGGETSIANCEREHFSQGHDCYDFKTVAGVICYNDEPGLKFLSSDLDPEAGQMTTTLGIEANNEKVYILENSVQPRPENTAVYCASLGYAGGQVVKSSATWPKYSVAQIECNGNEASILDCVGDWRPSVITGRGKVTTVTCFKPVRLVDGVPSYYGVVYATKGVDSGPVCANGFDQTAADLTCNDLGHPHGLILCCSPFGNQETKPIMDNIDCSAPLISHLTDCNHDNVDPGNTEACQKNYAAVACYSGAKKTDFSLSLSRTNSDTGYVVMTYIGIPGVICLDGWDDKDASVVCKQLGYLRGLKYNAPREKDSGPFWTSNINCVGTEEKLSDCEMTEIGSIDQCSNSQGQSGVICYDDEGIFYRLEGADDERWGRVEISLHGEWRSLCNLYWENIDAHVLCKHLGYRTGEVYTKQLPVLIGGPVWGTNFKCKGTEDSLNECLSSGWTHSTVPACAQHLNDAAAFCYTSVKLSTGVGREVSHGAVLLYWNKQWHKVCGSGFSDQSARAVCRELGFVDGRAKCCSQYGRLVEYPLLLTHTVSCFGDESDVTDCLMDRRCTGTEYASVTCSNFELINGTDIAEQESEPKNNLPIILGILIPVVLILIIVIVICVYRRNKNNSTPSSSESPSKEKYSDKIIQYRRDGSVEATNVMSGPEPSAPTTRGSEHIYDEPKVNTDQGTNPLQMTRVHDNPAYWNNTDAILNRTEVRDTDPIVIRMQAEPSVDPQDSLRHVSAEVSQDNPIYNSRDNSLYSKLHDKAELSSPRASVAE